jgi:hypothetical protein
VAAFAPDTGESVASLIQNPPPGAPLPPILPPQIAAVIEQAVADVSAAA